VTARLLLVRHGITDWNREGRFQGHLDPPLSDEGREEAQLLAGRLSTDGEQPVRVVSSPLLRARQTAEILAGARRITIDRRLLEIGQGAWEGRTHAELARDEAERYARWRASRGADPPPGGEPIDAAAGRVAAGIDEALGRDGWPLCVVAHGGILRLLAGHLLRLDLQRAWRLDVDNASLSVLAGRDGTWALERWNDTTHLLGRTSVHVAEEEGEPLAL
jgi:broad specificity phosphatase PhoE